MHPTSYSPINVHTPRLNKSYHEYLLHAGSSGIGAKFDEATGTLKLIFTETSSFHPIGKAATSMEDLGAAKFAFTVQQPEQLRVLSRMFYNYSKLMEWMQDPEYEFKDELMGRKPFDDEMA